jgi:hypothetical protein
MRTMRIRILTLMIGLGLAACDGDNAGSSRVDPSLLTTSGGDVALADGGTMSFSITSERYKQWDRARRAFPKSLITRFGQVLQPRSPTERSINAAVALLERNRQARQAIEGAGLSVRGFVELTVALEQQMLLASGGGARPEPVPDTYPMTMDTGYYTVPVAPSPAPAPLPIPVTPIPATPYPYPAAPLPPSQTYPPRDTLRRDTTLPPPAPLPPRDTVAPRRDSAPARRDTVVVPRPPRRDTVRDTQPAAPPDSSRRA